MRAAVQYFCLQLRSQPPQCRLPRLVLDVLGCQIAARKRQHMVNGCLCDDYVSSFKFFQVRSFATACYGLYSKDNDVSSAAAGGSSVDESEVNFFGW